VAEFAAAHPKPSAVVISDGLACFRVVTLIRADHEPTVTGGGKASVKLPQVWAVNTLLGNLKTAIGGTYHAFKFAKYAHRYLAEHQYRFNRRFKMKAILPRLLRALIAAPATPERCLRAC
jgi:hypothetical protein